MGNSRLENIQKEIEDWKAVRQYNYQRKDVMPFENPFIEGQMIFTFYAELPGMYCDGLEMEIKLTSDVFIITALSNFSPLDNPFDETNRLSIFLVDFDKQFYALVNDKVTGCGKLVTTTDPALIK